MAVQAEGPRGEANENSQVNLQAIFGHVTSDGQIARAGCAGDRFRRLSSSGPLRSLDR